MHDKFCDNNDKEERSMPKHLMNIMLVSVINIWALTGCDNGVAIDATDKTATSTEQTGSAPADTSTPVQATTTTIDWTTIDSGETPADLADYQYPFAIDSQNVKDYADYFKVDNAVAQHNLTVSMASNEALSKVLDQLSTSYTSHEIKDDKDIKIIIHTTADVDASSYDYVFAEDFAKGLVLPIEIQPDGVKSEGDVHAGS